MVTLRNKGENQKIYPHTHINHVILKQSLKEQRIKTQVMVRSVTSFARFERLLTSHQQTWFERAH